MGDKQRSVSIPSHNKMSATAGFPLSPCLLQLRVKEWRPTRRRHVRIPDIHSHSAYFQPTGQSDISNGIRECGQFNVCLLHSTHHLVCKVSRGNPVKLEDCCERFQGCEEGCSSEIHTFKAICKSSQSKDNGEGGIRRMEAGDDIGDDSAEW